MRLNACLTLLVLSLPITALAGEPVSYTWSSTTCPKCESTIVYSSWYPDGSPLIAEGMAGTHAGVLAALSLVKETLVLSLGLRTSQGLPLTLDLRKNVTVETNSSPGMVLFTLDEPGTGFHKDDVAILRRLNVRSFRLVPYVNASGFLFFPFDHNASHFFVVVRVGDEVFRFPFARDSRVPPRFVDPAHNTATPAQGPVACSKNVSFAVAEDGQIGATTPAFTSRWLEKNGKQYPGLCFSQVPDTHAANFIMVFAKSESEFDGIYPSVRDNSGVWSYTNRGTAAITKTTTTHVSFPFPDTTRELYAFSYDQTGRLVSRRQREVTTRRSGEEPNLGATLAASIISSHMKERLLSDAVSDLIR